jgi:hypothetical protein
MPSTAGSGGFTRGDMEHLLASGLISQIEPAVASIEIGRACSDD